jgi:raffinose/stachyose/melibiose transport system substrate-binding protein
MKKFLRLALPLLAIAALLLSACQPAATPAAVPTDPPAQPATLAPTEAATEAPTEVPTSAPVEKTKISLWLQEDKIGAEGSFTEDIVKPFNAQSDTVEVEVTIQANRWDATRTALAGGSGPDLIGTPGPTFAAQLARAGYLVSMDDFAEQGKWKDLFLPWALNLGKVDGKLYSVPMEVETLVLYYNKTVFAEHGWQPPSTMDELFTLCEEIKAAGLIPFAHANAEYRGANEWYVGEFLNHVAGPEKVYQALTGKLPWTDEAFVKAIDRLTEVQQNGWFMGGLDRYYTLTFAERDSALATGKAVMNIEGTWFLGSALSMFGEKNDNPNEWDWVPVPSETGKAIYDLGIGGSMSINKNTANPEAAAEFLSYYFSTEVQSAMVNAGGAYGPVPLTADALTGVDPRFAAIIEELGKASVSGDYGYTSWTFWPPKSEAYLIEIEKVWSGDMTSTEFLQALQTQFDEEKAAGELPPIPEK